MTPIFRHPSITLRSGIALAAALWALCCSGATGSSGGGGESSSGGPDVATDLPDDDLADAARIYCEHSVAESALQPPDALSRKQIQACLLAIRPKLNAQCGKGVPREIVLKIIVNKTGAVGDAFAVGAGADSPEATCAAGLVKSVVFPQFKGSTQQLIEKYPFNIGQ